MVVFLVPVKSRRTARSWTRTCQLFERTLRSICRQSDPRFEVLVVCHEIPDCGFTHPAVRYLQVDTPPPADHRPSRLADRQRKEMLGWLACRDRGRCQVFKVDADDLLSRHLAAAVHADLDAPGWYADSGFLHLEGSDRVRRLRRGFHRWCGTSSCVRLDALELIASGIDTLPEAPDSFARLRDRYFVPHHHLVASLRRRGLPMRRLPLPAAVYALGHGENGGVIAPERLFLSRWLPVRLLQRALTVRRLTPELRREFGLTPLGSTG